MTLLINDTTGLNLTAQQLGLTQLGDESMPCAVTITAAPPMSGYEFFVIFFAFLSLVIIFHELGHWLVLRKKHPHTMVYFTILPGQKLPFLGTGTEEQYNSLTLEEQNDIYVYGWLAGTIPIVLAMIVDITFLTLFVPYILGTQSDLKLIWQNLKEIKAKRKQDGVQ